MRVASSKEPIKLPLTQEQQEIIRRLSGQFAQFIEITPSANQAGEGHGRTLEFHWRLSSSTGIPRQVWGEDDDERSNDAPSDTNAPSDR